MSILQLYMEKKIERDVLFKKNILDMIKKYCKHLSCYYIKCCGHYNTHVIQILPTNCI